MSPGEDDGIAGTGIFCVSEGGRVADAQHLGRGAEGLRNIFQGVAILDPVPPIAIGEKGGAHCVLTGLPVGASPVGGIFEDS